MSPWTLLAVSGSLLLVAAGVALSSALPSWSGVGTLIAVVGSAGVSVVLALAAAAALGASRRNDVVEELAADRLSGFLGDLVRAAETASGKGILLLSSVKLASWQRLFDSGVEMLVRADGAEAIGRRMRQQADEELNAAWKHRRLMIATMRFIPPVCASAALASVLYLVVLLTRGEAMGTALPGGVLLLVCASFAIIAATGRVQEAFNLQAREAELQAELIIETLTALRQAETPEGLQRRLQAMLPSSGEMPALSTPVRRAA